MNNKNMFISRCYNIKNSFKNNSYSINERVLLLTTMMFVCISMKGFIVEQSENLTKTTIVDFFKWHPEVIYVAHPDMKLIFRLPDKKDQDQSGIANIFFQCKMTGNILLLDTIKGKHRYYNTEITSGKYDVILLYNNGNYIIYNDFIIENNSLKEVNMKHLDIQSSSSESEKWLNLRSFNSNQRFFLIHPTYSVSGWHLTFADANKWHPEAIYLVCPENIRLVFNLPHEKDQSGVHNLLFQSKETGKIHLLDTIKGRKPNKYHQLDTGSYRFYNTELLSGKYDAVLLYNNGKYIRYSDIVFEQNKVTEVNMDKIDIHPSDSISQHWLTMRAFDTSAGDRVFRKYHTTVSEKFIKGYIFDEEDKESLGDVFIINRKIGGITKAVPCTIDGYFEFDVENDENITLIISHPGYKTQEISIKANSGLFFIMERVQDHINVSTGTIKSK